MLSYIWPIALVVISNVLYNIITKSTPTNSNALLSLTISYLAAAVCSFVLFLTQERQPITQELAKLNWTAPALGVCIIGLEFGYIYAYRAGWKISTCSLVANISLACALLIVGIVFYKESITAAKAVGMALCIAGLVLITA